MSEPSLTDLVRIVRTLLPEIAFASLLARDGGSWREVDRKVFDGPEPQLPDDAVLDYAAHAAKPTYLSTGEEGSDFCLLDARAVLYLPLAGGCMLLYVVGKTAEAFPPHAIDAAWKVLARMPG